MCRMWEACSLPPSKSRSPELSFIRHCVALSLGRVCLLGSSAQIYTNNKHDSPFAGQEFAGLLKSFYRNFSLLSLSSLSSGGELLSVSHSAGLPLHWL